MTDTLILAGVCLGLVAWVIRLRRRLWIMGKLLQGAFMAMDGIAEGRIVVTKENGKIQITRDGVEFKMPEWVEHHK